MRPQTYKKRAYRSDKMYALVGYENEKTGATNLKISLTFLSCIMYDTLISFIFIMSLYNIDFFHQYHLVQFN